MTLTLYYTAGSMPSSACILVLRNLNLEVELKHINLSAGEQYSPEFLKINPQHKVPVLVDGDFVLTEGRAILCYLVNKNKPGSTLYPNDPQKRARIDQRLYYDASVVYDSLAQIVSATLFQKKDMVPQAQRDRLTETLNTLESFLSSTKCFAGDLITIADLSILPSVTTAKELGYDFSKLPKLSDWLQRCKSLPGFDENLKGAERLAQMILKCIGGKY